MCKLQYLLVLFALSTGATHSWEIAVTTEHQIEFYGNKTITESSRFWELTALAYDAVHNMLLFVDSKNDNASIFSYFLDTNKYQSLVRKRPMENIQGLAFDPVTSTLFWTDSSEKSIFWLSMKPGSKNDVYGNLLIKMDDEIPRAIAVDSCRGYIYWTNTNVAKPTIERARFDGTERKTIISNDIYIPVSLVIDQQTRRLYWADDREGIHYSIESSDLEGNNRTTLVVGVHHVPNTLTVSKDSVYWVDTTVKTIWMAPKNANQSVPQQYDELKDKTPYGIVANYAVEDETNGVPECATLASLTKNKTAINSTFSVPPDMGLFCVHGVKVDSKLVCNCKLGYTGERCDISVCQNFCFQGDCSITSEGNPTCRCKEGFSGDRCEINVCYDYCLNNGFCSLNDEHKPVCSCFGDHEGKRCERVKVITTTVAPEAVSTTEVSEKHNRALTTETENCNCTQSNDTKPSFISEHLSEGDFVSSCDDSWDAIRDPIIMVLGILCGLLFLACAMLVTKILQLKKRPRIKKRIIVNKNVTPMTARPDQCEITIENCCNMNICETPCFEPRSTIRPSLLDTKPGKEEKKNLISNMEYPDDF